MTTYHPKKITYHVTDSLGVAHKRTTERVYTHAVIVRKGESVKGRWCGRADLARKEAALWAKNGWATEIVEVK
jgi:hypothetical protein